MRPHFDLDGVVTAHRGPTNVVRNFSGLGILRPADCKLSAVGALAQKLGGDHVAERWGGGLVQRRLACAALLSPVRHRHGLEDD